jgi:hypothetical protein
MCRHGVKNAKRASGGRAKFFPGFGLARDESGFYRPAIRPDPVPVRGRRRRFQLLESVGQLKLDLGEK